MTVTEQSSEFDDELISAYLDDELTPDERARVDKRLAADPAARKLLDELRTVSRAMQQLPPEKLGADLRDSVLRRAERAMLVSGERASAHGPSDVMRSLPFGRSKRAWFWAAAAIAAGLMLMVFEQMPHQNRDLPRHVALEDRNELERSELDTLLRMRALELPDPPPDGSVADGTVSSELATEPAMGRELTSVPPTAGLVRRGVASSAPARAGSEVRDEVDFRDGGGGLGGGRASRSESLVVDADKSEVMADFASMIVNVQCNPEAMQNRTFDALFEKNQIEVERPADDESKPSELQSVDVVVVEAEPAQVVSCIKDISDDPANYSAIIVEDRSPPLQNDYLAKIPTPDVTQYNRGRFQNQQQVEIAPSNNRYYYSTNNSGAQIGLRFNTDEKVTTPTSEKGALAYGVGGQADGAPLAKMSNSAAEPSSSGESLSAANAPMAGAAVEGRPIDGYLGGELQENFARRASQKLATKAEMLQVLFVFQCPTDSPALESAPASAAAPATAAPVEKGIED